MQNGACIKAMDVKSMFVFFRKHNSYLVIGKRCESHGISISKAAIGNIVNKKGKIVKVWLQVENFYQIYIQGKNGIFRMLQR